MKYLKKFEMSDNDPFYSHNLRQSKGYNPKYKDGFISIRFQDNEMTFNKKFKDVDDDTGELRVNYQDLFSEGKSDFIKYFENKYNIKLSNYRKNNSDYFFYFECEPGKEKETIEKVAKDKIVKVVDYVDIRNIEIGEELIDIGETILSLGEELSEFSDIEINNTIKDAIERLNKLL